MTSAIRQAPQGGYNFAAKDRFRSFVWRFLKRGFLWPQDAHALFLMPSIEGSEIETALAHGFQERQLHICDANPAIVATLARRFPCTTRYGVDASAAHRRAAASGTIFDGVSLDFCGHIGPNIRHELRDCSASGAWTHGTRVVVNILRGREDKATTKILAGEGPRMFNALGLAERFLSLGVDHIETDRWRIFAILSSAFGTGKGGAPILDSWTIYKSVNGLTFLTCAFRVVDRLTWVRERIGNGHLVRRWNVKQKTMVENCKTSIAILSEFADKVREAKLI